MSPQATFPLQIDTSAPPVTAPYGPASPQHEKEAMRAIRRTNSWTPSFKRQPSYHQEDQKHALQMRGVRDVKEGPGFSECTSTAAR
ncbi:hypothetical protein GGS23DRAFT_592122 [Durotheca rogersii]|uniref:uncharacterized protein n=1 Tax=Durotheca rogersii TaxID=419775 RepID=UPI00221E7C16|nr:uncharacterized protein GGS23DRAFT_592122 [Durotheca rogersii]KAI5868343.1 hypothetical protein GGS23DRAFT_592122 [Durotheca rogersii]